MAFAYRYSGPTAVNRASWGPISTPSPLEVSEKFDRPLSGNFDRIINAFDRTNAFAYVRSTFEQANKIARDETKCLTPINDVSNETKLVKVEDEQDERFIGHGDFVVNRKEPPCRFSSFDRADGNLAARQTPCADDDVAEFYQERIAYSQARQLFPLQEDLADWINKTIDITYLNGDNFLNVLDNGVELCQLAAIIRDRAKEAVQRGHWKGPVPAIKGRCWQRAARRSFFSRDNMENFLTFCRGLGVHENLLFESDDLVLHAQPRQVILCLLEVSRLATRFGIEPPGLIQLEREIAAEERGGEECCVSDVAWQFRESSPVPEPIKSKDNLDPPTSPTDNNDSGVVNNITAESLDCDRTDGTYSRASSDDPEMQEPVRPLNELDKRVQIVTRLMQRNCNCSEGRCSKLLKVKKVGEGRYNIAGRNVFIRLLKGRHMMVRVGGGWDTLEHFLSRHEPCQVRLVSPTQTATAATNKHPTPAPINIPFDTASRTSTSSSHSDASLDDHNNKHITRQTNSNSLVQSEHTDGKSSSRKVYRKPSTSSIQSDISVGTNGDLKNRTSTKSISDNSDTDSNLSNSSNKNLSVRTGMKSPLNSILPSTNRKISPASNARRISVGSGKNFPTQNYGQISPTNVDKSAMTGKISPVSGKTSPTRSMSANSGKKSPTTPNRFVSRNPIAKSTPICKSPSTGKLAPSTSTDTANRKLSLTLPLKCTTITVVSKRKTPISPLPIPRKSMSTTAISSYKSPTTPVSKNSIKNPLEHRKSFCGTTNLNDQAKKGRSLSLASPINYKPLNLLQKRTSKSPTSDSRSAMTQANIEKGIENLSIRLSANSANKPFLHIKAKYRSPPPREVPPR